MNESNAVLSWVHQKYLMSQIMQKLNSIKNKCTHLAVTNDVQLNRRNNKTYGMKYTNSSSNNGSIIIHCSINM